MAVAVNGTTSNGVLVKPVSSTSTKAEEIAFLEKVVSQVGRGSYLDSLFTEDMVGWVRAQISNDFAVNLYHDKLDAERGEQAAVNERNQTALSYQQRLDQLELAHAAQVAQLEASLTGARDFNKTLLAEVERCAEVIERAQTKLDRQGAALKELQRVAGEAWWNKTKLEPEVVRDLVEGAW